MRNDAYLALRSRAARIDLPGRGLIRLSDEDRVRLLHAMCTNAIEPLQPGEGTKALFLNDKGRILAEFTVLFREQDLLLDTEAATRQVVFEHLDRYIIMDVVELEDLSEAYAVMALEGPQAGAMLSALGASLPAAPFAYNSWEDALLCQVSYTGAPGFRLYAPAATAASWRERLSGGGFAACDEPTAEVVRLEYGKPRHGVEYSDQHLVHEAQLLDYVSFTKGCYLGQEIVERVRSRGNVNRTLVRLVAETIEAPAAGTPVLAGPAESGPAESGPVESGKVQSAVFSPALGKVILFAVVRAEHVQAGQGFLIAGSPATLAPSGCLG